MRRISAPFVIYVGTAILSLWTSACLQQHTRLQSDDDKAREEELTVKTIGDVTTVANAQPIAVSGRRSGRRACWYRKQSDSRRLSGHA
ncbi:MAG: hypothetical protein KatS3mg105_4341 [Gemmatales bacterium]|nr:MAG: hypothetical protein KatS3mg105_4341 [Gemmatales bacterium]